MKVDKKERYAASNQRNQGQDVISPTAFKPLKILEICSIMSYFPTTIQDTPMSPYGYSLLPTPFLSSSWYVKNLTHASRLK